MVRRQPLRPAACHSAPASSAMPANSKLLPSKMDNISGSTPRKYSKHQATAWHCLATAQVDRLSDFLRSYSKKNRAAHRLRLPSARASTRVLISMGYAIDAQARRARSDFVFDIRAAVADLAGPRLHEILFFHVTGRFMPEHDEGALVVVDLRHKGSLIVFWHEAPSD